MSDNREMIVLNGEQIDELIRCKDCKWYRNRFNQHYCCQSAIDCPLPDDYCSRAERKNEVDNG